MSTTPTPFANIAAFQTAINTVFAQFTAALNDIAADEANLSAQIAALKQQIASGGTSTLSTADETALSAILTAAQAAATKSAQIAASIPNPPPPPPATT